MHKNLTKYLELSQTSLQAFMNGFFMGIIENVVNSKAETKWNKSKLWVVIQCFFGGADEATETYLK